MSGAAARTGILKNRVNKIIIGTSSGWMEKTHPQIIRTSQI